jgi:O-antigen ligase
VWKGVNFDLQFVAFCVYVVTTITFVVRIGDVAMVAAILGTLVQGKYRFPPPTVFHLLFVVWCLVGYTQSVFPEIAWLQLDKDFRIFLVGVVGMNVVNTTARARFFAMLVLAAYAAYPVRGSLFNYFVYGATEQGRVAWNMTFSNPNDLAAGIVLPFALAAAFLQNERDRYLRYAAIVGVGIIPLIIFLTGSRGAMLGLGVFAIGAFIAQKKNRAKMLGVALVASIVLAALAPKSSWDRLLSLADATDTQNLKNVNDSGSARQRYEIWKVARAITRDNFLFGVGTGTYNWVHSRYVKSVDNFDRFAGGTRDAHSTYLSTSAETGLPGLFFFMAVFGSAAFAAISTRRRLQHTNPHRAGHLRYLVTGLVAYGVCAFFGSYNHLSNAFLFPIIIWTTARAWREDADRQASPARPGRVPVPA